MRPIWKGHISFGLVNVPVTLYPAEERTDLHFHMIDRDNFARVRYNRVNAETGEEVPWDRIVKGYEYDEGAYVVIDPDELRQAAPEATQTVEIQSFVKQSDIDMIYFDKPYYLEPGKKGEKGYALLRATLRDTGLVGIAKVVIRTRQYMAAMAPRGKALVLNLLRFQDELRDVNDLNLPGDEAEVGVTKAELNMARTLVDSMTTEWDPSQYHDEYREAVMQWIDKRIAAGEFEHAPESPRAEDEAPVSYNIMDALKRSVEQTTGKKQTTRTKKKTRKKAG